MEIEPKPSKQKTTMSVPEMGKLLGLKKTEWYYLIQKNYFKTVKVHGVLRVYIDSFEEWYANQLHYKKVTGDNPGWKLGVYITKDEIERDLGINDCGSLLYGSKKLKTYIISGHTCVKRCDYELWYRRQFRYTKVSGELPGSDFPPSYSAREVADMLGIALRNTLYCLTDKKVFKSFIADGQLRIDIDSFETWYANQTHYKKIKKSEDR
ncbi:MAG: helix-turn-helix domain-containing protein [Clostridia bacterium]|nr:helix-turn-helix domain-containing protein [Clostridia bacterium]